MAPQVASLSELSRIRGDAEVRYPNGETEPKLSPRKTATKRQRDRGGGRRTAENSLFIFLERERVGERHKEKEGRLAAVR